jgi:hypothetical protein
MLSMYDPHSPFSLLCSQPPLYILASHLLMGSPFTSLFCSFSSRYQSWSSASSSPLLLLGHSKPSSHPAYNTPLSQCAIKSSNATPSADAFTTSMPSTLAQPMGSAATWFKRRLSSWAMPALHTVAIAPDTSTIPGTHTQHTQAPGVRVSLGHLSHCIENAYRCTAVDTYTGTAATGPMIA